MAFENIGSVLEKTGNRWTASKLKLAEDQYGKLLTAAKEYEKKGGVPGEFQDSHRCHHQFKDLKDVIEEEKTRYDKAHEEFQTLTYFYSCVNKDDIRKKHRTESAELSCPHGIDSLIKWAEKKNLPCAVKAGKEVAHLREMALQWDDYVRQTPFLGKLPAVKSNATNTPATDALITEAEKDSAIRPEAELASREVKEFRHKSNQYLATVHGLPKEIEESRSPAIKRKELEKGPSKDKDPARMGRRGTLSRKYDRTISSEKAEGDMVQITREKLQRMEQREEMYKAKIEELTTRLSSFASNKLVDANPNIADLSDRNRPTKIAEQFGELYDEQWSEAYEELHDDFGYTENKILRILASMAMLAFEFCKDMSETQILDLEKKMEKCMTLVTCVCNDQKYTVDRPDVDPRYYTSVNKLAREWRKSAALASVNSLCVIFKEHKLKECPDFDLDLKKLHDVDIYIDKCIELAWLMAVQQPKMHMKLPEVGDQVDKMTYKFYQQKGKTVHIGVWPAIFLYEDGPLVSKGYVLPHD